MSEFAHVDASAILFQGLAHDAALTVLLVGLGYAALLATSGVFVRWILAFANANVDDEGTRDTGRAIGKLENTLILILMLVEAYTALGVVFAAKSIVRREDMSGGDTSYYLTGTIANFTYTIVVGLLLHAFLWGIIEAGWSLPI